VILQPARFRPRLRSWSKTNILLKTARAGWSRPEGPRACRHGSPLAAPRPDQGHHKFSGTCPRDTIHAFIQSAKTLSSRMRWDAAVARRVGAGRREHLKGFVVPRVVPADALIGGWREPRSTGFLHAPSNPPLLPFAAFISAARLRATVPRSSPASSQPSWQKHPPFPRRGALRRAIFHNLNCNTPAASPAPARYAPWSAQRRSPGPACCVSPP
jgi:hypothetical protein